LNHDSIEQKEPIYELLAVKCNIYYARRVDIAQKELIVSRAVAQ